MTDPLESMLAERQQRVAEFDAVHEVVKSVDVFGVNHQLYRIEVYRDYSRGGDQPLFEVRYYIWWEGRLTPQDGTPSLARTWIAYDGPSTYGGATVEDTLSRALFHLSTRIHNGRRSSGEGNSSELE